MALVTDIKKFKYQLAARRSLRRWQERFTVRLGESTMLHDFSDKDLAFFLFPDPEPTMLLYDLIMGCLDLGTGAKFDYLEPKLRIKVMDIHLFILDQIRFECMRRLDWVTGFAGEQYPLVTMVLECDSIKPGFQPPFPELHSTHPKYEDFIRLGKMEGESVLRREIPRAIETFLERLK
ncbi:MAG: hypothetical protein HQK60_03175 [Deltaproteobacteria bacterium]|nr:hypothetical protein [Deltaproteobacteria bacterium]